VNPARAGAAYGYVDMGGWVGGQAEYVMVPYADFNLLKFPDKDVAMAKIKDLTLLSDIFPDRISRRSTAGVGPGMVAYVAGAGPVGLACAASCHLLGAAIVIVGDMKRIVSSQAKSFRMRSRRPEPRRNACRANRADHRHNRKSIARSTVSVFEAHGTGKQAGVERPRRC